MDNKAKSQNDIKIEMILYKFDNNNSNINMSIAKN